MQSFPYSAGPMSAGGAAVPGIPSVAGLGYPPGVSPGLTQYPTAPPATYPGYQGYPGGAAPQVARMPGPAMLGPGPGSVGGMAPGAGGVPGVSMGGVGGVAPPAGTGGPHPLPSLPHIPLPQGFPNPFEVQGLGPGGPVGGAPGGMLGFGGAPGGMPGFGGAPGGMPGFGGAPGGMPGFGGAPGGMPGFGGAPAPGVQSLTGPQGYLPGLGYFGAPGAQGQPGMLGPAPAQLPAYGGPPQLPPMPGRLPMPPAGPQGTAFPFPGAQQAPMPMPPHQAQYSPPQQAQYFPPQQAMGQAAPQGAPHVAPPAPAMPPMMGPQAQPNSAQPHPFWLQLAWQLVHTPAVKGALGEHLDVLLRDDRRPRTLALAASTLAAPELQNAFRSLTAGSFDQTRFTELFAERLKGVLQTR